jgi:hypothetical protein
VDVLDNISRSTKRYIDVIPIAWKNKIFPVHLVKGAGSISISSDTIKVHKDGIIHLINIKDYDNIDIEHLLSNSNRIKLRSINADKLDINADYIEIVRCNIGELTIKANEIKMINCKLTLKQYIAYKNGVCNESNFVSGYPMYGFSSPRLIETKYFVKIKDITEHDDLFIIR